MSEREKKEKACRPGDVPTFTLLTRLIIYFPRIHRLSALAFMEVEAVLDFLRKNGFTEAESALREDILEKGPLGSYEFEKFLFPMLPPLSIPETSRKPDADDTNDGDKSSTASSNDEFVSLESFPTDVNYSGTFRFRC